MDYDHGLGSSRSIRITEQQVFLLCITAAAERLTAHEGVTTTTALKLLYCK